MYNSSVPSITENLEKRRQIKIVRVRESRKIDGKPKKFRKNVKQIVITDFNRKSQIYFLIPDILQQLKQKHIEEKREKLERN